MTQTHGLNILNSSIGRNQSVLSPRSPYEDGLNNSQSAVRSLMTETTAPFTIMTTAKIPDMKETRLEEREERLSSLYRKPAHKAPSKVGTDAYA